MQQRVQTCFLPNINPYLQVLTWLILSEILKHYQVSANTFPFVIQIMCNFNKMLFSVHTYLIWNLLPSSGLRSQLNIVGDSFNMLCCFYSHVHMGNNYMFLMHFNGEQQKPPKNECPYFTVISPNRVMLFSDNGIFWTCCSATC